MKCTYTNYDIKNSVFLKAHQNMFYFLLVNTYLIQKFTF